MRNVNIETLDDFNHYTDSMFSNVIKVFWKDFGKYRTINLPRRHCLRFSKAFHLIVEIQELNLATTSIRCKFLVETDQFQELLRNGAG